MLDTTDLQLKGKNVHATHLSKITLNNNNNIYLETFLAHVHNTYCGFTGSTQVCFFKKIKLVLFH